MTPRTRPDKRLLDAAFGPTRLDAALDEVSASARNRWLLALYAEMNLHGYAQCEDGLHRLARGLALARMQDIAQRLDGGWCLYLYDGDNVIAHPMTERLWDELARWRLHIRMPPMPRYGEDYPLVQHTLHDPSALTPDEAAEILGRLVATIKQPERQADTKGPPHKMSSTVLRPSAAKEFPGFCPAAKKGKVRGTD